MGNCIHVNTNVLVLHRYILVKLKQQKRQFIPNCYSRQTKSIPYHLSSRVLLTVYGRYLNRKTAFNLTSLRHMLHACLKSAPPFMWLTWVSSTAFFDHCKRTTPILPSSVCVYMISQAHKGYLMLSETCCTVYNFSINIIFSGGVFSVLFRRCSSQRQKSKGPGHPRRLNKSCTNRTSPPPRHNHLHLLSVPSCHGYRVKQHYCKAWSAEIRLRSSTGLTDLSWMGRTAVINNQKEGAVLK